MLALLSVLAAPAAGMRGYGRAHSALPAYAALFIAAGAARTVHPVPQVLVFVLMTFAAAQLLAPSLRDPRPLTAVAFAALAWAAAILPGQTDWGWHTLLVVLGWAVVAAAVVVGAAMLRSPRLELWFYPVALVWFVVVALRIVTL